VLPVQIDIEATGPQGDAPCPEIATKIGLPTIGRCGHVVQGPVDVKGLEVSSGPKDLLSPGVEERKTGRSLLSAVAG